MDRAEWTPEQDAFLRECFEVRGWPTRAVHTHWPKSFPPRTAAAIGLRKGVLQIKTKANPLLAQQGVVQPLPDEPVQTVQMEEQGDSATLRSFGTEVRTIEELIARAKVDLTVWEVDRPETSMHETAVRQVDGSIKKVQQFRLAVKLKRKQGPSTQEQIAAMIAGAFADRQPVRSKVAPKNKPTGLQTDLMQAVVIADPHLAKYAWSEETGGADYDLDIASRLVDGAARELMAWGDERKPAVRYLFGLGDLLHYDNPQGHTTSGTPQDRDTRMAKMLRRASEVLVGLVERSAETAETRVVFVPGNHDRAATYAMQLVLANRFHDDPRVTVDLDPKARKYVEWGHCLIGLTHGDTARKRLHQLMQVEQKEAWGRSRVREWHHGHLHSEASTVTEGGVTIRQHLSLSPPDSWHALEGYVGAPRGMDSYLYHKDGYLRGTWRSPVLDG